VPLSPTDVHLVADERWAPLDQQLFSYRQRSDAQAVPALVVASILAKKLAAGAAGAGLEVRVAPHGNFGGDWATARANARRYKAVAALLELKPVAILTDAGQPFQPYVGRGESLIALAAILSDGADEWLLEHVELCRGMADALATTLGVNALEPVATEAMRHVHEGLLLSHGAEPHAFEARVRDLRSAPRAIFSAPTAGSVEYDLGRLRDLLVGRQRAEAPAPDRMVPDPAGVILAVRPGDRVEVGTPVMSVRVPKGEDALAAEMAGCVRIRPGGRSRVGRDNAFETV
jgi:pyrimidine-nucleoside phosphorylase